MVYYPGKFHPWRWKITRPRFVHPSPLGPTEGGQNTHRLFHPDGWNFTPSGFLHLRGLEGGIIPTKIFHPHHLTTSHLDPPHLTSPVTPWVEYYPPDFSTCISDTFLTRDISNSVGTPSNQTIHLLKSFQHKLKCLFVTVALNKQVLNGPTMQSQAV